MRLLLAFLICFFINAESNLPPEYRISKILPMDFKEIWYSNAYEIEKIFNQKKIQSVVEVGSWLGYSTSHFGKLVGKDGVVYAIDHWKGSSEHHDSEIWSQCLPSLYDQFISNMIHKRLYRVVRPLKMSSLEGALIFKQKNELIDLIYIDASHDTESVLEDLNAWFPVVKGRGILCGDDWGCSSVRIAVERFAQEHNLSIYAPEGGNFYRLIEK